MSGLNAGLQTLVRINPILLPGHIVSFTDRPLQQEMSEKVRTVYFKHN